MKKSDGLKKALDALDARVERLGAALAQERRQKDRLAAQQSAILQQEQLLARTLNDNLASEPSISRFYELRLRRLSVERRQLQPSVKKAELQGRAVEHALKDALRKRLGVSILLEDLEKKQPDLESEADRAYALFEMKKRP
ncbi:hypothetical protein [Marivita sp. S2033]|uniref:hypothetical protein n=1 Tax=Marivita sp. S2033 TaxID=3373187 RepID=UPI00398209F5